VRTLAKLALASAALILISARPPSATQTPASSQRPKLLVVLVVDQMRADYLTTFNNRWRWGFRRLLETGAVFDRAEYPYLNTVTCAGHSTIGTGTFPHTHGMVLNAWWHRDIHKTLNCMEDAEAPAVTYGPPSAMGNSPRRLMVDTLADTLRAANADARVVTVSLKPRSAIGLAGHAGTVTWYDDSVGAFSTSRAFASRPVPAVKSFVDANPIARDLGKAWTLRYPAGSYRFADDGRGERPPDRWNRTFPHQMPAGRSSDRRFWELWQESPFSDVYLGRIAASLVDELQLGQRDAIDFLGVSFSALDVVGHDFGPNSREIEDLLVRLDETIGTLLEHLDRRVGRDKYVLGLSADHGVAPIPKGDASGQQGGRIVIDDLQSRIEQALVTQFGPADKASLPHGYVEAMNFVYAYLAPGVFDRLVANPAAMKAVERAALGVTGVERVLRRDQLSTSSSDPLVRAAAFSQYPDRSGDLIVTPRPYWFLAPRSDTAATTHGTAHSYDKEVPVIVMGAGVKAGHYATAVTPADIAPTLANQAGIPMSHAEGRVLREALIPRAPNRKSDIYN
jgi:predicted AlkP superfamily pyrophosphatase or phosphodiesterase